MVMPVAPGGPASPAGSSPIMASQSPGNQVAGIAKVRQALKLLEQAIPDLGSNGEIGSKVLKCIRDLAAIAPANKTTAGAESSQLAMLAARAKQMAPMLALSRAQGQGGMGGGMGGPQMGGGGM